MAKSYDASTKRLIDEHPSDWLALLGLPLGDTAEPLDVEIVDSDLSTISLQADRVLKVAGPEPYLSHFEMETGHHGEQTPAFLLRYNVFLTGKYRLPVRSAVILLRREADHPTLTGLLEYQHRGEIYLRFSYRVIRVWQLPLEALLIGGLGTLPLAPLAQVAEEQIPEVIQRMQARIQAEATVEEARELWAATNLLMGLRFSSTVADELLKGIGEMQDSTTYQAIVEKGLAEGMVKGRVEGERELILRQATLRLGKPSPRATRWLESVASAERLMTIGLRLLEVESWEELMSL